MIKVYQPQFLVRLHKTIMRRTTNGSDAVSRRFAGSVQRQVVDLAPFLGEGSVIATSKSVSEPAGGFQLMLVDRPDGDDGALDTIYAAIEPMDIIEIRARHSEGSGEPPIIMRGFVSSVSRGVSAANGAPQRSVMVEGQDYGKLWQIIQINYLAGYLVGQQYISGFPLFEQYGIAANLLSTDDFAKQVLDKIINPYLAGLMPDSSSMPRSIAAEVNVTPATVSPGIQGHQGTIYEMMRYYGDVGPWNELYMEDRDDGVTMVYRAAPFVKTDGTDSLVQPEAPAPVYVDIPAEDIVSMRLSRSDSNVANFYWVASQRFNLIYETQRQQEAMAGSSETVNLSQYPNADIKLYGVRMMRLETAQGGPEMNTQEAGRKSDEVYRNRGDAVAFMDQRRQVLVDSNRDNIVLESGTLSLRGNEAIKAGTYIRLTTGKLVATYYVNRVDHRMIPFVGFFTDVEVVRGTGFVARILQGGSPYFEELQR